MFSVRQDVHARLQHASAHRQSAQQTQAVAVSVLRKELCNYQRPEAALVEVHYLPKSKYFLENNLDQYVKAMGWGRSTNAKTVDENSQTGILRSCTGDPSKHFIKSKS